MNEIEEYYCGPAVKSFSEKRWFDRPAAEDIPSCIFTQEKYRPLRQYALFRMGFSVVTIRNCRILREIIGDGKVLEVMCGLGSYTAALRSLGVDVRAADDMSWMESEKSRYRVWKENAWIGDIEPYDAVSAVRRYGPQVSFILMSWPPQNDPAARQTLEAMREVNPACRMIYIGEQRGGCTADDSFFDSMIDVSGEYPQMNRLRETYRRWENDGYFDAQYIVR